MNAAQIKALALVCMLLGSVFIIADRFNISTDLGTFLPDAETKFDRLLRHQLYSGTSTNIILLGFKGLPEKQLADFNHKISDELMKSGLFSVVRNNASNLDETALNFLEENRYLLTHNELSEKFSVAGLSESLQHRIEGLSSSTAALEKKYLRQDPSGEVLSLLDEWQGKISRHKKPIERHGTWFSEDLSRTLILLEIKADVREMTNQEEVVHAIRDLYKQNKVAGVDMIMAGPAVFAVELSEDIKQDLSNLTFSAVSAVVLFLLVVYRSPRMVLLVALPLLVGVIFATAVILLLNGQIHGITLAFGITLAGVAVDYPIHLLTGIDRRQLRDENRIKDVWRTLRVGVFSTVIAYAAFLISGFHGLQQLGWFTIIGLTTAALVSRWLLPFLATSTNPPLSNSAADSTAAETNVDPGFFHTNLKKLAQNAGRFRLLVPAVLLMTLGALVLSPRPILHLNVDSLSPISEARRAEGKMLRGDLGFWYGGSMMLLVAENKQQVLLASEKILTPLNELVKQETIAGFDMAAHFLPSENRQIRNLEAIQDVEAIEDNLRLALTDLPFKPNVFKPFLQDLESANNLQPITPDAPTSQWQTLVGNKLDSLLFPFEAQAAGVILLHDVANHQAMNEFAAQHPELYYMHLKSASTDLVARSVERVFHAIMACILIIYIALAFAFKCVYRPLKVMVPTFTAAIAVAAILVFSGNPLSIFHLISLLLVIGLGLDYSLFFNRLPDHPDEWNTTFKSIWVCGITTILVFGILSFSTTPPLEAIGITVALGASLSIVFAAMWAATPTRHATLAATQKP